LCCAAAVGSLPEPSSTFSLVPATMARRFCSISSRSMDFAPCVVSRRRSWPTGLSSLTGARSFSTSITGGAEGVGAAINSIHLNIGRQSKPLLRILDLTGSKSLTRRAGSLRNDPHPVERSPNEEHRDRQECDRQASREPRALLLRHRHREF